MRLPTPLVAAAVLACGALLSAQGTYKVYGTGCAATTCGRTCGSANTSGGTMWGTQNQNTFAIAIPASNTQRVVCGFEFFTHTKNNTPLTIKTQLFLADAAGKPQGNPVRTGTMTLGTTAGWYRTSFKILVVNANQRLALSYTPVQGQMWYPIVTSGNATPYYWHPPANTTWQGPFTSVAWAWRLSCVGSVTPALKNNGVPTINTSFSVDLTGGRGSAPVLFILGLSDKKSGSIPLPWDLTAVGAPGCWLWASLDLLVPLKTDSAGKASIKLTVPNNATLKGLKFFNQWAIDDPGANQFGMFTSNGGAGTIG